MEKIFQFNWGVFWAVLLATSISGQYRLKGLPNFWRRWLKPRDETFKPK